VVSVREKLAKIEAALDIVHILQGNYKGLVRATGACKRYNQGSLAVGASQPEVSWKGFAIDFAIGNY
jgi:hypothetical protein